MLPNNQKKYCIFAHYLYVKTKNFKMKSYKTILFFVIMAVYSLAVSAQQRYHNIHISGNNPVPSNSMHKVGNRDTAPLNSIGISNIPVILVQFSDRAFKGDNDAATLDFFKKHFNGNGIGGEHYTEGNSYGSVFDYYNEESDGLFQPQFSVIGPVTLSKSYAYYGQNNGTKLDVNIGDFYAEACHLAIKDYAVNWSDFDNNKDGKVDFVFFIYAGEPESYSGSDPNNIWPKEGSSEMKVNVDGQTITFSAYGCANEKYPKIDQREGIGNICHELSHALGLPDFYNTSDPSVGSYGMDYWSIMDYGQYSNLGYHPCALTAYEREFLGWRNTQTVNYNEDLTLTLEPMEQQGAIAYKIVNPQNSNEYFILENRQNLGWDGKLAFMAAAFGSGHGLMITHVDYDKHAWEYNTVNNSPTHQRMTLVVADGDYMPGAINFNPTGAKNLLADTYPGLDNITEMSSYATFTGGSINMKITEIKEENQVITLKLNKGGQATSIQAIADTTPEKDIRDLFGRRVSSPNHGIFIINGKKIFLK